ncbi:MAG TPA: sulfatase-like hydrolase/transferase [Candidatus Paceibacterota bacterium]|nr:sulfatase-like hydrolase/transferase [Verrucomicrobiota bacterium]HRZ45220.1 sulfatase-like hydrolase/transferase [Candidatus Paceibacterota bacterium]
MCDFLARRGGILPSILLLCLAAGLPASEPSARWPNIVFILADDLGYGDLGCYGQKKIRTPNIDRLAAEGMRLTAHYSGNNVCAPSRCVLMTGLHPGHAFVRDNRQARDFSEGQTPVPPGSLALPLTLQQLGYATGAFGKWGLGPFGSTGDPLRQGIDRFFGFNCQAVAHNYYPTSLWDNAERRPLDNPPFSAHQRLGPGAPADDPDTYARFAGRAYAPDLIGEQALEFISRHRDRPFFLYYPTTVPHLALQAPADSLAEYAGQFPEEPYLGDRGYLPHPAPRAAYAAMITRMDREVGRVMARVHELGLDERTIFVFTSDNGPLYDRLGGTDADFFDSAAGLRGRKGSFYEGGFRVPCIVRWTGHIAPGSISDRVTGFEDWLPTLLELAGDRDRTPPGLDGISFAPTLRGQRQPERPFLYRESPGYGGQQCLRVDRWKAIRRNLHPGPKAGSPNPSPVELYDLAKDPAETTDLAAQHPGLVERFLEIMRDQHAPSELFPLRAIDPLPGAPAAHPPAAKRLRVAAVQMRSAHDLSANAQSIAQTIRSAPASGIRVLLFPECALSGYAAAAVTNLTELEIAHAEGEVARACRDAGVYAIVGMPYRDGEQLLNSAAVITPSGRVLERYHKIQLAESWPAGGDRMFVFPIDGVPCSIIICHDERYPELVRLPVLAGAQVVFYLSHESGLRAEHKIAPYRAQIQARAVENTVFVVHANAPANPDASGSHGHSRIIAPDGNILQEASIFEETILAADLDIAKATRANARKSLSRGPLGDWWKDGIRRVRVIP